MNDLDQFKQTYITECFELLEEMEEKLLTLPDNDYDLGEVNAIFRCAHSIKGGAGAFGFRQLVSFTHEVEALLDGLRSQKLEPTEDILEALLQSADIIVQMVQAAQKDEVPPAGLGDELKLRVQGLANGHPGGAKRVEGSRAVSGDPSTVDKPSAQDDGKSREHLLMDISFVPHRRLFESGNEPLLIIRELKRLGEVKTAIDIARLSGLDTFDVEECYLSWTFEVSTAKGMDAVKEVFEFVEEECDLTIEEFGAISMPVAKDLSEEDEFGGIFSDMILPLSPEGRGEGNISQIPATVRGENTSPQPTPSKGEGAKVSSMRVDIEKVDQLVNMVGELVITQAMLVNHTRDLPVEQFRHLHGGIEELTRHTRELQEAVMAVRMQPVKSVFARMPRIVRDLSRSLGKDVRLEMSGEATEIDKTVIEQLGDPLTHMIRNSIDHGIEKPEARLEAGKPEQGVIRLSADNSGGRITIEVSDDGGGINRGKVLAKAKEKGLFAPDAQPPAEVIDGIVFMAGFSTAEKVTDVSGRGVGMDVVKRNIEELGGTIEIINNPGIGLKFMVSLPLTLAILDGMIVRIGKEFYIIPINNILESLCPDRSRIEVVTEGHDVLNVRGEFVPILYLSRIFGTRATSDNERMLVMLVENRREKFGLVVDEIIGQQQVVIKSIEENSDPVPGVSGATILGNGSVSLILDIAKLQHMVATPAGRQAA